MAQAATHPVTSSEETAEWIDVSVPIHGGMVHWPDNPPIELEAIMHLDRGDICTVSALRMGLHTGTHIDGPNHFIPGASGADSVPLENLIGPARVVEIGDHRFVTEAEISRENIGNYERILFKTSNSRRCWNGPEFVSDCVSLAEDAASYLADLNTMAVGIDYLSIGSPVVHRILFKAGVVVIEGLNLSRVSPGEYELLCLPLRVLDGDGAPTRALLKPVA